MVKNKPANAADTETQVQSLGGKDPMEYEMATHSNILAWEIPWTEEGQAVTIQGVTKSHM